LRSGVDRLIGEFTGPIESDENIDHVGCSVHRGGLGDSGEAPLSVDRLRAGMDRNNRLAAVLENASHPVGGSIGTIAEADDEPQSSIGEKITDLLVGGVVLAHAVGRPRAR